MKRKFGGYMFRRIKGSQSKGDTTVSVVRLVRWDQTVKIVTWSDH